MTRSIPLTFHVFESTQMTHFSVFPGKLSAPTFQPTPNYALSSLGMKQCMYKKEKSLKMKGDVGMACQQTRKDKSDGEYTKPHLSLHLFTKE